MRTRNIEAIHVALFAVMQAMVTDAKLRGASRRLEHVNEFDIARAPVGFQHQLPMKLAGRGQSLPRNTFRVDWYFYVGGMEGAVHSTQLNELVDEVLTRIAPSLPGQKQTLGGLVEDVYVEGEVEIYEGVLADRAVAIVPLTIVAPGF